MLASAILLAGAAILARACASGAGYRGESQATGPHLGRAASQDIIRRMDITVMADGIGLPGGSGSVPEGRITYEAQCASCHGPAGEGGLAPRLTGGVGSLRSAKPVKTVASYWPYAPTLFDYIRRAMPLTAPQSLNDWEIYGLVAYLLSIDGIVAPNARLDGPGLSQIRMPNRNGFISLESQRFDGNIEYVKPTKTKGE